MDWSGGGADSRSSNKNSVFPAFLQSSLRIFHGPRSSANTGWRREKLCFCDVRGAFPAVRVASIREGRRVLVWAGEQAPVFVVVVVVVWIDSL